MKAAVPALLALALISIIAGCGGGADGAGTYELIPGVPFPAYYALDIVPQDYTEPIPLAHQLSIVAPTVSGGHDFDVVVQPIGSIDTVGALEVVTARTPASAPTLSGRTIKVKVQSTDTSGPVLFRGVVGYEATGATLARTGSFTATFDTEDNGVRIVEGTFDFTTTDAGVAPAFRTYKGTFTGVETVPADGGSGGGSGPPPPPY